MVEKRDDVFIAVMKYMRQETIQGRDLGDYSKGIDHIHVAYSTIDKTIIRNLFQHAGEGRSYLAPDAYFQLMEHEELQEARLSSAAANQASLKAYNVAIGALVISSAIGIAGIINSIVVALQSDLALRHPRHQAI